MIFHINNQEWTMVLAESHDPMLIVDGTPTVGATWIAKHVIAISNELPMPAGYNTIMHELVHAYLWTTQMRVPPKFTEEDVCCFFERWGQQIVEQTLICWKNLYKPPVGAAAEVTSSAKGVKCK